MAPHDDEDTFSDWGDLEDDALAELENNAIQFTQAQRPAQEPARLVAPSSDYGDDFEDGDLDDNVVIDESRSTPALNPTFHPQRPSQQNYHQDQFLQRSATNAVVNVAVKHHIRPPPHRFNPSQSQRNIPHRQEPTSSHRNTQPQEQDVALQDLQRQIEEVRNMDLS